jgi:biotin transporter BioY
MQQGAEMKLITLLATCLILVIGWITYNRHIAIAGGVLFLAGELGNLILSYRAAVFYREGQDEKWLKEQTQSQEIVDGAWNWLFAVGLVSWFVGGASKNEAMEISGIMLYAGRIVSYLIGGFIVQNVSGVPLRMTHVASNRVTGSRPFKSRPLHR